ncbi:3'-5' exonuclease [Thiobacter aerophilum]|uniref:3'-5' exonuclease n=1 Tax=Thiobacter aerophilum TaxID=3121275 RepID=A0ABV0EGW1_9BURK
MDLFGWLRRLTAPALDPIHRARLAAWQRRPAVDRHRPFAALRWVVVDVESSGLDVWHDRLISIGAVALAGEVLALGDSLEVVLQQEEVSGTANILVHGIGGTAQRAGLPPPEALLRFLEYTGRDPLVAFHAAFDVIMIWRALRDTLGLRWKPVVLDLADLLPALFPALGLRTLDEWLAYFSIDHYARHQALSDAYATAQLMQVALARAREQGYGDLATLLRLARDQRALARFGRAGIFVS